MSWRKRLGEDGWNNGARSIFLRMRRAGQSPPSVRTIHRVLMRRGLVTPAPQKRPWSSYTSFVFARTNDCWQTDATECELADGSAATVFYLLDDCSRKSLVSTAGTAETAVGAWTCVSEAMTKFGIPAMVLLDNGSASSAKPTCRSSTASDSSAPWSSTQPSATSPEAPDPAEANANPA